MKAEVHEALLARTREARSRLPDELLGGESRPETPKPPRPGDLFVLPQTAELPLEWAVLRADAGRGGRVFLVPADTHLLAGRTDFVIDESAPCGPLVLRLGHGLWLATSRLDPTLRTGTLSAASLASAMEVLDHGEGEGWPQSAVADEEEREAEYQDWLADVVTRGRQTLLVPPGVGKARLSLPHLAYPLAALFFVASVGLGVWSSILARRLADATAPMALSPHRGEVVFADPTRGPGTHTITVDPARPQLHLALVLQTVEDYPAYRVEVVTPSGRVLWQSEAFSPNNNEEIEIQFRRGWLPAGGYHMVLYGIRDGGEEKIDDPFFRIEYE